MNKILMATAIALVAGAPLAFAKPAPISSADLTTLHCDQVGEDFAAHRAAYKSYSEFLAAEQNALSLCRQNKDHGAGHASRASEAHGVTAGS